MQEGKENGINNFGKLLRNLEMDNVAIPQLRQLKQEHAYLEKLKLQRVKIEELKAKHDKAEQQLSLCSEDIHSQKQLIEEQHRTVQLLEHKLEESERKRNTLETTINRTLEQDREKQRNKHEELLSEITELRKENKSKDIMIFEMEDLIEQQKQQQKEQGTLERRRITADWEEKLRSVMVEANLKEKENQDLKELVTRQHKALQMQNEQFEESSQKTEELTEVISRLEEELGDSIRLREQSDERLSDVMDLMSRMEIELNEQRSGQSAKDQVDQLRKKVSEMAKGEIERIEFLVSEFD